MSKEVSLTHIAFEHPDIPHLTGVKEEPEGRRQKSRLELLADHTKDHETGKPEHSHEREDKPLYSQKNNG